MPNQVSVRAMTTCNFGAAPSSLVILSKNKVLCEEPPSANTIDYVPLLNIILFGVRRSPANPMVAAAWGANANCYAFACNCPNPAVGNPPRTARPSVAVLAPVLNNGNVAQLNAGGIADVGLLVQQLGGNPAALPLVPANSYLIAMLTSATGFHFLRRDEFSRRWSRKDANHANQAQRDGLRA